MEIRDLDEWKAYCLGAATRSVDRDHVILTSAWGSGTVTPPPALEDPHARIPLERAECLERLADEPAGEQAEERTAEERGEWGRRHLQLAIAWLEHPHPRASNGVRAAMRREHDRLQLRLAALDPEPG